MLCQLRVFVPTHVSRWLGRDHTMGKVKEERGCVCVWALVCIKALGIFNLLAVPCDPHLPSEKKYIVLLVFFVPMTEGTIFYLSL